MKILKTYDKITIKENEYPFIPLREIVIFPNMQKTFYVGRLESIQSVEIAKEFYNNVVFLATQKDPNLENPNEDEIYKIGVIAKILDIKQGPDAKILKLLVVGLERGIIKNFITENSIKKVLIKKIDKKEEKEEKIDIKTKSLLEYIIKEFKKKFQIPFGIHCHNDCELAVANSVTAIEAGASQVQGTFNGFGERCGNANLVSIIPIIELKLKKDAIGKDKLKKLKETSRYIYEIANLPPPKNQPFVGESAFAHKGGVHVSAINKNASTYEHISPEEVGNRRRILISDLSGKSNIFFKAKEFNIDLDSKDPVTLEILNKLKELELQGYQFEGAEASFELLMMEAIGQRRKYFELIGFRVIDEKRKEGEVPIAEATVMIKVGGNVEHTAAVGNGPVNALDNAMRKALERFYPELKDVKLLDYKVRVLSSDKGTAAGVRVLIESGDKDEKWGTVGVSQNIIEASYQALVDSIEYKLYKEHKKSKK